MKFVSEIISVVLILVLSIGLISVILLYGYPLIMKTQDRGSLEKALTTFSPDSPNSIIKEMEFVTKYGGAKTINLDLGGVWKVASYQDESELKNSISYVFLSKVTNVNSNRYISLSRGEKCPPEDGIFGVSSPFVTCIKGEQSPSGFTITYTIFARNLTSEDQIYYVRLISSTGEKVSHSTLKTIRASRESIETIYENNKKVIIVTLKITL